MNGGISAGHSLHFIVAHYVVGEQQKGDTLLRAMLSRQEGSGFQNGVINSAGGVDWTTWNGTPCGYEGYLADVFAFLQAIVLRDGSARARLFRPMKRAVG